MLMCTTLYYLLANLQITKKSYLLASVPNWKCVAFKSLVCCLHSARFLALEACPWFFCQKLAKFRILHNTINSNIFQDRLKYKFFQSFEVYQLSFFKFLEQNQNCWDDFYLYIWMVMGQLHEIKKIFFYLHSQPYMYLPIKDGRLFNRGVQSFRLKKTTKSGPFRHFFWGCRYSTLFKGH